MGKLSKYTLVENMDISPSIKRILINNGYIFVKDLSMAKSEDIKVLFTLSDNSSEYVGIKGFEYLKSILHHDYKLTFLNEYDEIGINSNDAIFRISELPLSIELKGLLTQELGVYTFGDLLTTDYDKIINARNMKEDYIVELKKFIHGLGYLLKNEEPLLDEVLSFLKNNGKVLLEEVVCNPRIYMYLYQNHIYTLEDLKSYGKEVYNLDGFEILKKEELKKLLKELNIVLNDVNDISLIETSMLIKNEQNYNEILKNRIAKKQELFKRLNKLKSQNRLLSLTESDLDNMINDLLNETVEKKLVIKK